MAKSWGEGLLFLGLLSLLIFSNHKVRSLYALPFPPLQELVSGPHSLEDVAMIVGGFRSVAADVAWIQLLQNVSGNGPLGEDAQKPLPTLKEDTLRVVRIDPYFHRAYLFGAVILAWFKSVDRPEEALEILQEGIRNNPNYWVFRSTVGAIVYKKKEDFPQVAHLLEDAVSQPDCPGLIKAILANTYKSMGQYRKALEVWGVVLDDPDNADYHARARNQIRELEGLIAR
jgi:tetratricopeptide (TPR) repeat protein